VSNHIYPIRQTVLSRRIPFWNAFPLEKWTRMETANLFLKSGHVTHVNAGMSYTVRARCSCSLHVGVRVVWYLRRARGGGDGGALPAQQV
jgi:hypothetical protein